MALFFLAAALLSVGELKRVEIVAVDAETNKPLGKAVVRVFNGIRPTPYVFTDAAGKATVEYPPGGDLTIDVHTTKHIQQRVTFTEFKPQPATMTLQLRKGTRTVGGLVVDEDGKPVAGATVRFSAYLGKPQKSPGITELVCDIDAVTGADGRWSVKCVDESPTSLRAHAEHPDFAFSRSDSRPPGSHEYLTRTAKQTLKRGLQVRGVVRDEQGRPIAGASVLGVEKSGLADDRSTLVQTSADGGFRMPLLPGRNTLIVQAAGRSPAFRLIWLVDKPGNLTFTLPTGRTVRGRVVDAEGQPVVGVNVSGRFEGLQSDAGLRLAALSGADGAFAIPDAPAQSFNLHAWCEGFTPSDFVIPPGRNEISLVLKPFGAKRKEAYAADLDKLNRETNELRAVRSKSVGMQIPGLVKTPDGRAAAGALILLATKTKPTGGWFVDGALVNELFSVNFATDEEGRFRLPLQGQPYALAVSHDSGWALWRPHSDRNRREPPEITLTPWATIEGTFLLDGKPTPKLTLQYWMDTKSEQDDERGGLSFKSSAETDAEGRFVMRRVPPIAGRFVRYIALPNRNSQTHAEIIRLHPKPGEKVELGEVRQQGRTVVGRLKLPAALQPNESEYRLGFVCDTYDADVNSDRPSVPYPKEMEGKPRQARTDWWLKWRATPEGRKYRQEYQQLRPDVEPNGRFRMDGVKADSFIMNLNLRAPSMNRSDRGDVLATASKKFVVPPMPKGYEDEPLDLGEVEVVSSKVTPGGEKLADFTAKTLDGKPWKLSSDAGKVRILDFWATWCGHCIEAFPEVAALHEELGERISIVGLSVDDDAADAAELVRKKKCDWRQVHIGPKSPLMETLGVEQLPTFIVVDRDGKVCYRGPYVFAAAQAARQALSR